MSPPGMDAGRDRPLDPNLAKALSHPLRQRILERLSAGGEASPNQLARILDRLGFIELVGTRQIRGALEHHYRALTHPWLDAEQWAQLPAAFRRLALARTLRDIVSDASDAGVAGGFDHPDTQIRRLSLELDGDGWSEVARLLDQTFTALQQIYADSLVRAGERKPEQPTINAEIAVLLFRSPPTT